MKTQLKLLAIGHLLSAICLSAAAQGSLTPPGAPAPTMKSLSQVEPRTPIAGGTLGSGPSISQPGSYYLTDNIIVTNDSASGIWISGSNVTLDLNGFSIIGTRNLPQNNSGISANFAGVTNVTIRNGRVSGFGYGVISSANNTVIEHLTITDSRMRGINIIGNSTSNFVAVIRNNTILNTDLNRSGLQNGSAMGILTQGGANGVIENNVVSGVFGLPSPSALIGYGIEVEGATHMLVINNRVSNANTGIFFNGSGRYRDNVTMAVSTAYSGGTSLGNNQ
ncbi:MAG TPA: right-handed parallel beta-helix repeat-containing protein [Candidatus Paceibacterota bacterium]|nr:right-handed parallel beta-helix repeat-containing protein [Candidatus Paceibacterota bacterium]